MAFATKKISICATVLVCVMGLMAFGAPGDPAGGGNGGGQGNGGGGQGGGRGGQGGRQFDPAAMQQRMMQRLQERMGSTDDEFAAIKPKLEKVMTLQRDMQGGRGMMGGGRGGRGGNGGPAATPAADPATPVSPIAQAAKDLQTTLDNKDAPADDIKTKLDAYRAAKSKAKDDLAAAQKDLKDVLNHRQEATLVLMGMLD